ncbi:MAG: SRPBCC domain-containing protein [Sphingobacteriales bacterium]|nr:MAG: SRPBCC domain-containing protein [Sphingobacteriales bacterium]
MSTNKVSKETPLIIVRQFDATKNVVFDAFTNPEAMAQWWGPADYPTTVVSMDFKPGGLFHYKMEANGKVMYGRFIYGQIQQPDMLEFTDSFSDENAGIIRAPFSATWPLEIFNQLTFTEEDGKTTITFSGYPVNATEEETETFSTAQAGIKQGFAGTFNQLDTFLKNK